jgi:hypothetical protein
MGHDSLPSGALGFGYLARATLVGKITGPALAEWRLARNVRSLRSLLGQINSSGPCTSSALRR